MFVFKGSPCVAWVDIRQGTDSEYCFYPSTQKTKYKTIKPRYKSPPTPPSAILELENNNKASRCFSFFSSFFLFFFFTLSLKPRISLVRRQLFVKGNGLFSVLLVKTFTRVTVTFLLLFVPLCWCGKSIHRILTSGR